MIQMSVPDVFQASALRFTQILDLQTTQITIQVIGIFIIDLGKTQIVTGIETTATKTHQETTLTHHIILIHQKDKIKMIEIVRQNINNILIKYKLQFKQLQTLQEKRLQKFQNCN